MIIVTINKMDIRKTFLDLTSKTYPYGYEDELVSFLPKGYFMDEHGNYFYKIGNTRTAFTSHFDTACKDQVDVVFKIEGDIIRTNGKSILGADDKAGVTILLYMISKKVPGLYCFFIGEEVGCIGSGKASKDNMFKEYDRMVSFDRRGTSSIITFQSSKRCCSSEFANQLSSEYKKVGMNMIPDDTGVYTDSAEFTGVIPECTNISVGYYKEHTFDEHQDMAHLIKIANASVKINWESLVTKRNAKLVEYKPYNYASNRYYGDYSVGSRTNKRSSYSNRYDRDYYDDYPSHDSLQFKSKKRKDNYEVVNTKSSRVYMDSLDNDITDSYYSDNMGPTPKKYYETLKQIIFDDNITSTEFEIIKEQYLNMSNKDDQKFAKEMEKMLIKADKQKLS